MGKLFIVLGICLFSISAFGQSIEVLELNKKYQKEYVYKPFKALNKRFDITELNKIAVLKGSVTQSVFVNDLLSSFWNKANQFGANSFIVDSVHKTHNKIEVCISVFCLTDEQMEKNSKLFASNKIFVFGNVKEFGGKKRTIKVNGEKEVLSPFEYLSIKNEVGHRTDISIGGFMGSRISFKGEKQCKPVFLSLQGLNFQSFVGADGSLGTVISTGDIHKVDHELGNFMIHIFNEKEFISSD
jgi:hypothetical protein